MLTLRTNASIRHAMRTLSIATMLGVLTGCNAIAPTSNAENPAAGQSTQVGPNPAFDGEGSNTNSQEDTGAGLVPIPGRGTEMGVVTQCETNEDCNDSDGCTKDFCTPLGDCLHAPLVCMNDGFCNPETGVCEALGCFIEADCDDGDACTDDFCYGDGACGNEPLICPDGEACNPSTGACESLGCAGDPDCDDGDACTDDLCHPDTGECFHSVINCNDDDDCTTDSCDPDFGCINEPGVCDDETDPLPPRVQIDNNTPYVVMEWSLTGGVNGFDSGSLAEPGETIAIAQQDLADGVDGPTQYSIEMGEWTFSRIGPVLRQRFTFTGELSVSPNTTYVLQLSSTAILGGADADGRRWVGGFQGLDRLYHPVTLEIFRSGAWNLSIDGAPTSEGRIESEFADDDETLNMSFCQNCEIKQVNHPYDRIEHQVSLGSGILGRPPVMYNVTLTPE